MSVSLLIVTNQNVEPEVVEAHSRQQDVRVVSLVVVGDPSANESPEALDEGITAESSGLLLLPAYVDVTESV